MNDAQHAFQTIFNPNEEGISEWVSREDLDSTPLAFINNGNNRHGKPQRFPKKIRDSYKFEYQRRGTTNKGKVTHIRTSGYDETDHINRDKIGEHVRNHYNGQCCVVCGSHSDMVMDHKNDLYNDPRVLDKSTQTVDDFQPLCNGCNLKKREISVKTINENRRIGATYIPQLAVFGVDFIEGDETLNRHDPNAMRGTYWYDPIEFMRRAIEIYIHNNSNNTP
tara:strand:- start:1444 stop:2109 length:666 start_codon:yes stop_codon:yes gene_type:complete